MSIKGFLSIKEKEEISTELTEVIRQAITEVGSEKVIIIGQINIQVNSAQGGGAKVLVTN